VEEVLVLVLVLEQVLALALVVVLKLVLAQQPLVRPLLQHFEHPVVQPRDLLLLAWWTVIYHVLPS
jgi:hypothetical protein